MALLTTILVVISVLGGVSLLLWYSAFIESRHLGSGPRAAPGEPAGMAVVSEPPEASPVEHLGHAA